MKRKIILLLVLYLVAGCSTPPKVQGPTPDVKNFGSTPIVTEKHPGFNFRCHLITEVSEGPEVNGIQIGVTTYEEVIDILNPDTVWWNDNFGFLGMERLGLHADTCFWGNIISILETCKAEGYPEYLNDFIEAYGNPDDVTWGNTIWCRSLIWADEGILATIDLEYEEVGCYVFFPPVDGEELASSWLMESIGPPDDEYPEELLPLKKYQVEDPWGFTSD